jgi:CheY-like chemotaxis protein
VLTAAEAAALDPGAKLDLIWQPGFSTAATVTDISGRGVGLDIVRSAVERVRGEVTVESAPGKGTTFVLTLPLSLSVVRTLLLRDGEATVAVPITQVEGVHLVGRDAITPLVDRTVAMVEGRALTLLDQGLARPVPLAERLGGHGVVVLEVRLSADRTAGCVIDEVLGEEDTLVKALPRYLRHRSAFVGCSVAGNGRPYAIVDLQQLVTQSEGASATDGMLAGAPGVCDTPLPGGAAEKPLVLIVDDSLFMRRSLTDLYQNAGFRVETAEDGEEALATIARIGLPDLISLDMEMPRLNGLEMLSALRQLPGGDQVPVFMVTTRGQERHRREALKAGVSRYFIKPFDSAAMLAAARATCGIAAAGHVA